MSRLKEQYQNEIVDAMIKKFGYKNIMEVPKLDKVVINMGVVRQKTMLNFWTQLLQTWRKSQDRKRL